MSGLMMTNTQIFITILIASFVTIFTRFAAFLLFPDGKKVPAFVVWLGRQLPMAVMAMLLVYCLKDVSFQSMTNWLPAFAAVAVTVALHFWKKQMIISITGGTMVYMILIRLL